MRRFRHNCTRVIVSGILLFSYHSLALKAVDYDKNNNGLIEKHEFKKYLDDSFSKPVAQFDIDNDGNLSVEEISKANEHLNATVAEIDMNIGEFEVDYPEGQGIAEFSKIWGTEDKDILNPAEDKKTTKWLVRSALKDVSIYGSQLPASSAEPATLSFARDVKADNDALGIKGVIGYPVDLKNMPSTIILPSLEFNQLSNSQEDKQDVDSIVFRLGVDHELDGIFADTSYFGYGVQYATDSDFKMDVRGFDISYEPILLGWGQGANRLVGPLLLRWRAILLGEAGEVKDVGSSTSLKKDESYFRLGGDIDLRAVFKNTPKVQFGLEYAYLDAVHGDLRDRKLFSASLSYDLDDDGHYKLETRFTDGDRTIALEDEESWTIGLGIRF